MLSWAVPTATVLVIVAMLVAATRLARGPSVADRVVALDMLAILFVPFAALMAAEHREAVYLDVAITIALLAFLGTLALAGYVRRRALREDEGRAAGGRP